MEKPIILITVFLFAINQLVYCQDADDFEKWLAKDRESFNNYQTKADRDFTKFLERDWSEFQMSQGLVNDAKPKPTNIPSKPAEKFTSIEDVKLDLLENLIKDTCVHKPVKHKTDDRPIPTQNNTKPIEITYFNTAVQLTIDDRFNKLNLSRLDNHGISGFWNSTSSLNYNELIDQLEWYRANLQLNDWGYLILIDQLSQKLYPKHRNNQRLFTWFVLLKIGLNAKIGYNASNLFILIQSPIDIYDTPYFTLQTAQNRYYICPIHNDIALLAGSIYTYDDNNGIINQPIDFYIRDLPIIQNRTKSRVLTFDYKKKKYKVKVDYDQNMVDYFNLFPQTRVDVFFSAPMSTNSRNSIIKALKPIIEDKTEAEAVNIILRFMQTAFEYATDQEQFSTENFLFAEETLFYKYSDCEDRSILFAYLVREMIGLEVIGLDYPGHIATAVRFNSRIKGNAIKVSGKTYTICDPTYINANIGQCMPQFVSITPKPIRF